MRTFWMFRSNLKALEYYHQFNDLETFEKNCHDFYMLFPLWLLKNNDFDEVVIWRLTDTPIAEKIFTINNKKYIQRWVNSFSECLDYPSPDISFFRGGFKEYDEVTKLKAKHFRTKLYLGAGRRVTSQWGGKYDAYLMEDERDFDKQFYCLPFYKTASPHIFFDIPNVIKDIKWDVCWPCNFEQLKYKGQELFIRTIARNALINRLKIVHCGNKPEVGKKLCKEYYVNNIEFVGPLSRPDLNQVLNHSAIGLNLSNLSDGCPRVSTEILMSGTPLVINEQTRLLQYFKQSGVVEVNENNLAEKLLYAILYRFELKSKLLQAINNELSFDSICQKNLELWLKL